MVFLIAAFCIVVHCYSMIDNSTASTILKNSYEQSTTQKVITKTTLLEIEEKEFQAGTNAVKTRFKRQQSSGAGSFTESAAMPETKVVQLLLIMFKNLLADVFVDDEHRFHESVPRHMVHSYKNKILKFFFPEFGKESD